MKIRKTLMASACLAFATCVAGSVSAQNNAAASRGARAVRAPRVVHEEAGRVLRTHGRVPERARELDQALGDAGRGAHALDHLDHLHERHGAEEMQPRDALGLRASRRDRRHR